MRLINRHRHHHSRGKAPRIQVSQEEITADLLYPARPVTRNPDASGARRRTAR